MSSDGTAITPAQARLLAEHMRQQAQLASAAIMNDGNTGDAAKSTTQDFSNLLQSLLSARPGIPIADQLAPQVHNSTSNTGNGLQIAQTAIQLASDLQGVNNRSFDTVHTPQIAQQVWNTSGWGNGNLQCVAFVAGAYQQAGVTLPAVANATDFFANYTNRAGWSAIPNGQGLPQAGDIIAMSGGSEGYGHVAIVTAVTPPQAGKVGSVTIAQSNAPVAQTTLPIAPNGQVVAWAGYPIQGFIRPTSA